MLHFDGTSWKDTQAGELLVDFWDMGDEVFGVGFYGTIKRFDGERWHTMVSRPGGSWDPFFGIWGSSPDNIFAVGQSGMVRHYDGSAWRTIWLGTESHFYDIWGLDGSVFIIGNQSYMGRPR